MMPEFQTTDELFAFRRHLELDDPSLRCSTRCWRKNAWLDTAPWQPRPMTAWSQTILLDEHVGPRRDAEREEVDASTDVQRTDVVRLDHVERRRSTAHWGTLLILRMATLLVLVPADRLTYWR